MSTNNESNDGKSYQVIELHMMKSHLFLPLAGLSTFSVHTLVYPFQVVRTRLQLQQGKSMYRGLLHACSSIYRLEGFRALYSGYFIKTTQHIAGFGYMITYESVRSHLGKYEKFSNGGGLRSFIAGTCASSVAQTILVPFDIVSQHLMALNVAASKRGLISGSSPVSSKKTVRPLTPLRLSERDLETAWSRTRAIVREVYTNHGAIRGFYNGFFVSVLTFGPSHGLWWLFYTKYCEKLTALSNNFDLNIPRIMVQQIAAPLTGCTNAFITNPLDVIRVRMQVDNTRFFDTVKRLWAEEGLQMFHKGLSARITQSFIYSSCVILFYERVKIFSLKEEYEDIFRQSMADDR